MGKGTIVSGGAEGLYSVTLNLARERIQARIALAQAAITNLETLIAEADAGIATIDSAILALRAQISLLEEDPVTNKAAIETALNSLQAKLTERAAAGTSRGILVLQKAGQEKRIQTLQALPADPTVDAWCCDLTENLTGEVGTIEVPGERGTVLIRPGYNGGAVYNHTRDGQLFHPAACTAAGAFFNFAVLPGWQKWKPTYRTGEITALAGDTCSVDLHTAYSSAQSLGVNQAGSLTNVPIEYMDCNGAAFAVGDSVVIEFTGHDFSAPKVIGFTEYPKGCGEYVVFTIGGCGTKSVVVVWDPRLNTPLFTARDQADVDYQLWATGKTDRSNPMVTTFTYEGRDSASDYAWDPDDEGLPYGTYDFEFPTDYPGFTGTDTYHIVLSYTPGGFMLPDTITKDNVVHAYRLQSNSTGLNARSYANPIIIEGFSPVPYIGLRITSEYHYDSHPQWMEFGEDRHTLWTNEYHFFDHLGEIAAETCTKEQCYDARTYSGIYRATNPFASLYTDRFRDYFNARFTEKVIASACLIHYVRGTYDGYGGGWTLEPDPITAISAQALWCPDGSTGFDFIGAGRNNALETELKAAVRLCYSLNSVPAATLKNVVIGMEVY